MISITIKPTNNTTISMKTRILLTMAAMVAINAFAAEPLLVQRAALTDQAAVEAFDAAKDKQLGDGVMAGLVAANALTPAAESVALADLYLEDKLKPAVNYLIMWDKVPHAKKLAVLNHLAAKQAIAADEIGILNRMPYMECPALKARQDEILALVSESSFQRYQIKYTKLSPGTNYLSDMTPQELMKCTAAIRNALDYDRLRKEVLARCIGAMTRYRRAANLPNDATSFDTAMAPVLAALNAPLWDGLQAATSALDIDLTPPDYTGLIETLARRCADLEERKITDATGFAGSLMFWKGTEEYKSWAQQYK